MKPLQYATLTTTKYLIYHGENMEILYLCMEALGS